ncbi:MAG: hypothetical protein LCH46_13930 [Proteobacteria bacterium]|nr:hypothetical protein [Pseudomonadota bacterium]
MALKPNELMLMHSPHDLTISVKLLTINEGPTPASLIHVASAIELVPAQAEWRDDFSDLADKLGVGMTVFSKAEQFVRLCPRKLTDTELQDIKAGRLIVQVRGKALYSDIFESQHAGYFNFRLPTNAVTRIFACPEMMGNFDWSFGPKHNFTD